MPLGGGGREEEEQEEEQEQKGVAKQERIAAGEAKEWAKQQMKRKTL